MRPFHRKHSEIFQIRSSIAQCGVETGADARGDLIAFFDNPVLFVTKLKNGATLRAAVASLERTYVFIKMKQVISFEACVLLTKNFSNTYYHLTILYV